MTSSPQALPFRIERTTMAGHPWMVLHYDGLATGPDGRSSRVPFCLQIGDPRCRLTMPALHLAILDTVETAYRQQRALIDSERERDQLKERVKELEGRLKEMNNRLEGQRREQKGREKAGA